MEFNSLHEKYKAYKGFTYYFSSSHYYWNPQWPASKNQDVFGLCSQKEGHGHDYRLEVLYPVQGTDWLQVKSIVPKIVAFLDHKNLNQIDYFQNRIPTTEALAQWICYQIAELTKLKHFKLRLYETEHLWVEIYYFF